jgi:hypothetical protein
MGNISLIAIDEIINGGGLTCSMLLSCAMFWTSSEISQRSCSLMLPMSKK